MIGDVVAEALVVLAIDEVARMGTAVFSPAELGYAKSKADPERRLAARLAAKRAACQALGGEVAPEDVEVARSSHAAPRLRLAARAEARLKALGAGRALVSLTHGRTHAAAVVLLLRAGTRR